MYDDQATNAASAAGTTPMADTTATTDPTLMNNQFVQGAPVFDVDGDKVGTVSEHGVQGDSLVVHHGLFREDLYVPLSVITSNTADGVTLAVTKQDAYDGRWDVAGTTTTATTGVMDTATPITDTTMPADTMPNQTTTATAGEDVRVPLAEEQLVVGKQQEEIGRVRLHKDVVEEQQTVTEPVTREQVRVDRVAVQGNATPDADAFTAKDIDVPVMGEEIVAGKRAVVTDEVRVHKDAITDQQDVTDTVRKERLTVDGADDNAVTGADVGQAGTTYDRNTQ